ncbi:MAG: hypothetical protein AAF492_24280, partial [Verrucomicrobiota bacterium]
LEAELRNLGMEETRSLVESMSEIWEEGGWSVSATAPGRFVVVCRNVEDELPEGHPPQEADLRDYGYFLPRHRDGQQLRDLLERSHACLSEHSVNEVRLDLGENPANGFWIWGGGRPHRPPPKTSEGDRRIGVLSHSRLALGLAELLEIDRVEMKNPWTMEREERDTFAGEVLAPAIARFDFLLVYIEAPFDYGRYGSGADKVRSIELLDQMIVESLNVYTHSVDASRVIITTDTTISSRTSTWEPGDLPFILAGEDVSADGVTHWDESDCREGSLGHVYVNELERILRSTF